MQNIKCPPKKQKLRKISTEQEETDADEDAENQDNNSEENTEEFELIEGYYFTFISVKHWYNNS